jgi:hypothetical protein
MRVYIAFVPLLLLSSTAYSQQPETTYNCVTEFAGAGWYNSTAKRWEGGALNPRSTGDFNLRMTFIGRHNTGDINIPPFDFEYYNVFIEQLRYVQSCVGSDGKPIVIMGSNRIITCFAPYYLYSFNPKTNRFLKSTLYGFIDGDDSNVNQPYIAGGTCTKVE